MLYNGFEKLEYRPDIERRGQGKQQTGEQDCRSRELKLAVLSVLEIASADLDKEQDCQDHVDHRKHDVVDDLLDLGLRLVPGVLNGTGHVAGCKRRHAEGTEQQGHQQNGNQDANGLRLHVIPPQKP